ncbi:MAG: class I SAM-dependent RNA methyltransferase [Gemmatimonadetes bacterium]|nr:MAG: class I SAM-dependent RNA methyltransferase [Gemmatimonadota bacterium]
MPTRALRTSLTGAELFAATAPGLESIAAGELKTLGIKGRQQEGGVVFEGNPDRIYLTNLWLRTASRVLLRLGRFHASTFYELERRARKLSWNEYLPEKGRVEVRVTCRKSRLYHSDAVAERVLGVIAQVAPAGVDLRVEGSSREEDDSETENTQQAAVQLFVVRIVNDECEISADTSGELLHRRGYRQEIAKAPLRETLAAAMILASGWRPKDPLLDPMCGSGTIPIEAALIGHRRAPGLVRRFQFMNWPSFDQRLWNETLGRANESIVDIPLDIRGADRDSGAIRSAQRNAERAGVAADIQFSASSVSESFAELADVADMGQEGWIITNPPYGVRVGESTDLRDLYATLGTALKGKHGWRIGVLAAADDLARQIRLPLRSRFASSNGGIPVSYLVSERDGDSGAIARRSRVRQGAGEN